MLSLYKGISELLSTCFNTAINLLLDSAEPTHSPQSPASPLVGKTSLCFSCYLNAAFSIADHNILLKKLEFIVGIKRGALQWIES